MSRTTSLHLSEEQQAAQGDALLLFAPLHDDELDAIVGQPQNAEDASLPASLQSTDSDRQHRNPADFPSIHSLRMLSISRLYPIALQTAEPPRNEECSEQRAASVKPAIVADGGQLDNN
jgi:hypothetical protein